MTDPEVYPEQETDVLSPHIYPLAFLFLGIIVSTEIFISPSTSGYRQFLPIAMVPPRKRPARRPPLPDEFDKLSCSCASIPLTYYYPMANIIL
jgi:hypothetical protein